MPAVRLLLRIGQLDMAPYIGLHGYELLKKVLVRCARRRSNLRLLWVYCALWWLRRKAHKTRQWSMEVTAKEVCWAAGLPLLVVFPRKHLQHLAGLVPYVLHEQLVIVQHDQKDMYQKPGCNGVQDNGYGEQQAEVARLTRDTKACDAMVSALGSSAQLDAQLYQNGCDLMARLAAELTVVVAKSRKIEAKMLKKRSKLEAKMQELSAIEEYRRQIGVLKSIAFIDKWSRSQRPATDSSRCPRKRALSQPLLRQRPRRSSSRRRCAGRARCWLCCLTSATCRC